VRDHFFTREEHIQEAERLAIVIDDLLQDPKAEARDMMVAGVFAQIGQLHVALGQMPSPVGVWHRPGREKRGHPVSECAERGCSL